MVVVARDEATLLVVSESGMGKRSEIDAYRLQKRGGKGVINLKTTERTGKVVAIKSVVPGDQLMLITRNGVINRQRVDEIRVIGRATQGVRLVNLDKNDSVMDVARVIPDNGADDSVEGAPEGDGAVDGEGVDSDAVGVGAGEADGAEAVGGTDAESALDSGTGDAAGDPDTESE
jgi:DNA gyrase subunit A